jgi:hypothetical protein
MIRKTLKKVGLSEEDKELIDKYTKKLADLVGRLDTLAF